MLPLTPWVGGASPTLAEAVDVAAALDEEDVLSSSPRTAKASKKLVEMTEACCLGAMVG